jgi:hypothetical protein
MLRLAAFLRNPLSFLFTQSVREERVAQYVIREHGRGRTLDDILQDHYVLNRLSPHQQARLIERHDVIHAVSTDDLEAARQYLGGLAAE